MPTAIQHVAFRPRLLGIPDEVIDNEIIVHIPQALDNAHLVRLGRDHDDRRAGVLFPDLLAFLYDGWMKQEDSHMQELQTAVLGELEEMKKTAGKNEQEVQAA